MYSGRCTYQEISEISSDSKGKRVLSCRFQITFDFRSEIFDFRNEIVREYRKVVKKRIKNLCSLSLVHPRSLPKEYLRHEQVKASAYRISGGRGLAFSLVARISEKLDIENMVDLDGIDHYVETGEEPKKDK